MSLLDGLESLGLGNLEKVDVVGKEEEKEVKPRVAERKVVEKQPKPEETEESYVYTKEYECPVCDNHFKATVVKTGKARLIKQDKDLRPIYKGVDSIKYDVVLCNRCGYAVLSKYYGPLPKPHKELLIKNIASNYRPMKEPELLYSYEEALLRFKLALVNAVCRQAKDSEKALICLRTAWLVRGMKENFNDISFEEEYTEEKLAQMEEEYLKDAYELFIKARQGETPPIAGMNDITLDYLLAVLSIQFEKYEDAAKLLTGIISSTTAGSAQKDKARDLILELKAKLKQRK